MTILNIRIVQIQSLAQKSVELGRAARRAVEKSASGASFGQLKDQEEKASTGQRRSAVATGSDEKLKLIRELS